MNRFMMAGLLAGLCAMPVRAEHSATVGVRLVDLDSKWNKQGAMEYDGKLYYGAQGDVSVGNQGEFGLFDFSLKDIGSREEAMAFNLDYKSGVKASAKWEAMHHRTNLTRTGQIINGRWWPNSVNLPNSPSSPGADKFSWYTGNGEKIDFNQNPGGMKAMFKRTETEVNLGFFAPANSAQWIAGQYWSAEKVGYKYTQSATNVLGIANIDNTRTDLTLGAGTNVGENGALSVDMIRSEFQDNAAKIFVPTSAQSSTILWPDHQMTAAEMKWRYDAGKKLSLTGALTARQRENTVNLYKMNAGVAALNAAYRATDKLSLTGRLYVRYVEIDENAGFRPFNTTAAPNTHEFDKLTVKGDLGVSFRPVEKVRVKADYKVEMNHRRDAPSEIFSRDALFADGLFLPGGTQANSLANDDMKHVATLGVTAELPLGAEFEAGYKKLYANRAAFINLPTRSDEYNALLMVPLPGHVEFTLMGDYAKERNAVREKNYHMSRNAYRAGLDWEHDNKTFVGVDGSYETIRYNMEQYYQMYNNVTGAVYNVNMPHEGGALNSQKNTTLGAHARALLPKGFVVLGNGSYTWSVVRVPVNFGWAASQTGTAVTPAGTYVNDVMPSEVRIARGTLGFEYTPEKFKNLTARASYTVTDYVDRIDSFNSGRASIAQAGASYKF